MATPPRHRFAVPPVGEQSSPRCEPKVRTTVGKPKNRKGPDGALLHLLARPTGLIRRCAPHPLTRCILHLALWAASLSKSASCRFVGAHFVRPNCFAIGRTKVRTLLGSQKNKRPLCEGPLCFSGAPDRIRTCDPCLRRAAQGLNRRISP